MPQLGTWLILLCVYYDIDKESVISVMKN